MKRIRVESSELLNLLATRPAHELRNVVFNKRYFEEADLRILSQVSKAWRAIIGAKERSFWKIACNACVEGYWNQLEWILQGQKLQLTAKAEFDVVPYEGKGAAHHSLIARSAARNGQAHIMKLLADMLPPETPFEFCTIVSAVESKSIETFRVCFRDDANLMEIWQKAIECDFAEALEVVYVKHFFDLSVVDIILHMAIKQKLHMVIPFLEFRKKLPYAAEFAWNAKIDLLLKVFVDAPELQKQIEKFKI